MKTFKVLSAIGVCSAIILLGQSGMASPIVGGTQVVPTDIVAKRTVGLFFILEDNTQGLCSGSILDDSRILTAAHCVRKYKQGVVVFSTENMIDLVIQGARQGVDTVPALRFITAVKQEPGYSGQTSGGNEFNDLAIVTFAGGLPPGYEPAKFLTKAAAMSVLVSDAPMKLAGYGITAPPAPAPSPAPGATPATVVDDGSGTLRSVASSFGMFSPALIDMYLFGPTGHNTCEGDSGGPAMVTIGTETYVVGVLSRSDCVQTSIYTFVNQESITGL